MVELAAAFRAARGPLPTTDAERKGRDDWRRKAREALKAAVRIGKVAKPDRCEVCRKREALDGHHTDYNEALDVVFLCKSCHTIVHNRCGEHVPSEEEPDDTFGHSTRVGRVWTVDGAPEDLGDSDARAALDLGGLFSEEPDSD